MNRRDFLKSTLTSLAITGGALAISSARTPNREALDYVFFDERFEAAEGLARRITGSAAPIPVRGDVTPVWNGALKSAGQGSPLMLAGVTTESFYFCLKTLMRPNSGLELSTNRISQDLIAWSIRSSQPIIHGRS
jgi:hypothetical protein